jgi:hypothetical protein
MHPWLEHKQVAWRIIFQIRRRREHRPATSSSITFCRNNGFLFSVWFGLQVGCGDSTTNP